MRMIPKKTYVIHKRYFIYLVYLLLVTSIVSSVSLSKYAISIGGSDTAVVARPVFSYEPVSATLNGDDIPDIDVGITHSDIKPGDELVYHFRINNFEGGDTNQVTLKYIIEVFFDPDTLNLPFSYTLEPVEVPAEYSFAEGSWTYLGFEQTESHSYTLTINWDETDEDPIYQDKQQSIRIEVNAQQVD